MNMESDDQMQKYLPFVEDLTEFLQQQITPKTHHLNIMMKLKELIIKMKVDHKHLSRCEHILKKMQGLCLKVNDMRMEHFYERANSFKPFLVNLIKKMEARERSSNGEKELKYVKSLLLIIEKKKLNPHNIERCETALKKLSQKIELNTLQAIRYKARNIIQRTDVEMIINHRDPVDVNPIMIHLKEYDPRILQGKLYKKPKKRSMELWKVTYVQLIQIDRLAYKYKNMIKTKPTCETTTICTAKPETLPSSLISQRAKISQFDPRLKQRPLIEDASRILTETNAVSVLCTETDVRLTHEAHKINVSKDHGKTNLQNNTQEIQDIYTVDSPENLMNIFKRMYGEETANQVKSLLKQEAIETVSPDRFQFDESSPNPKKAGRPNREVKLADQTKPGETVEQGIKVCSKKKRGRTELDKLNEDINEMFIRDGVLNATGKRNVPVKTYREEKSHERIKDHLQETAIQLMPKTKSNNKIKDILKIHNISHCYVVLKRLQMPVCCQEINQLKNTNCHIHHQSEFKTKCVLCNYSGVLLTLHYVEMHPAKEVFISRINPDVAANVLSDPYRKVGILQSAKFTSASKISMNCKICMHTNNLNGKNWKIHLMAHTGEFKCKGCDVRHGNPNYSKQFFNKYPHKISCKSHNFVTEDIHFEKGSLIAFMCRICYYIQLQKKNVLKHLEAEHEDYEDGNNKVCAFEIVNYVTDAVKEDNLKIPPESLLNVNTRCAKHFDHTYSTNVKEEKDKKKDGDTEDLKDGFTSIITKDVNLEVDLYFSTIMSYKNPLKVWSNKPSQKTEDHIHTLLTNYNSLSSFYKCMAKNCSFTSHEENGAKIHYDHHTAQGNSLECSYCDSLFLTGDQLLMHLKEIHETSIYQCGYCFYRSCTAFNVVTHQQHYHDAFKPRILKCIGKQAQVSKEMALINSSREKYVPPLLCTLCHKKWYIFTLFEDHLLTHTEKTLKCQACKGVMVKNELLKHLHLHRIGLFECVYCYYGTNEMNSIRLHMSTIHPTRLLYVVVRQSKKGINTEQIDEHSIESTVLVHIGSSVEISSIISLPTY